ncbi:MAG: hypothetical protein WD270_05505 [Acetobacterales bacterium]
MEEMIGAGVGSGVGLIAILLGALYNAHLQRKRDDRLREEERRGFAAALFSDLVGALMLLSDRRTFLEGVAATTPDPGYDWPERLTLPPLLCAPTIPMKVGLLDPEAVERVVLAFRSYEMAGMLLRLSAAEARAGTLESSTASGRAYFINGFMGNACRALESLAAVAGCEERLADLKNDPFLWRQQ